MRFSVLIIITMMSLILMSCGKDDSRPLQPPKSVTTEAGIGAVTVHWTAVAGATSYIICFSTTPALNTYTSVVVDANSTSLTIGNLTDGQIYYFAVKATSGTRMSALSTIISGIPFRVSKLFGGNHVDGGSCTTTDSTGNILIGGNTSSYPFDETYGNGGTSAFVTKRTSKGDRLWTRLLGKGNTWAFAIATGQGDDVYIAGYTADDLDGTHTGWSDFFIAKYDSDGQLEWVRQLGVAGTNTQAKGLAVDGNGNAYIIGVTGGDLSGIPRTGNWDMFVAKYDLTGERQWLKLYGDSGSLVEGKAIVATSSGFVVTGTTSGWFYGEKGSLTPVFVMVCDISGNRIWSHTIGANITTKVAGIGLNADGDIYITGYTDGSLMGNPKIGLQDIFLTKFSAGGDHIWTKTSGSSGRYKNATGIMIDASGIYIVGTVTDSQAYFNLFLEKYTADGERIWSVIRGTEKPNSVTGITAFADRIYVVGSTTSFEENPALGYSDVFLAGFNSEYGCY